MRHKRTVVVAVLAVVTAAAIALAIVGFGGSSASSTPTADVAAMEQFRDCMSQHGAELPSGGPPTAGAPPTTGGAPSVPQPSMKMQRALRACQQYAPQGAPPGGFPAPPGSS